MRRLGRAATIPIWLLAGLASATQAASPQRPFPQHASIAYAPGSLLPSHRSRAQLDDDVRNLYDAWKSRYLAAAGSEPDGHPRYRVKMGRASGEPTVSEAQGAGLIATALLAGHDADAQQIFDGLLEFAKDHRSSIDPRLMDWYVAANEGPDALGDDSAFDGDADIALGLLLAQEQWGNDERFDYGAEAAAVIAGLMASAVGPQSRLPLLGDWVEPGGSPYSQYTPRSSDFMLSHFRAFYRASGDTSWLEVVAATSALVSQMQADFGAATGLLPDFLQPLVPANPAQGLRPADPSFLEGPNDGFYYYNAARDPLRLARDALLGGSAISRAQAVAISQWFESASGGDPAQIRAGYALDGTPLTGSNFFSTAFAAPLGAAAMLDGTQQSWLDDLYDAVRSSDQNYFEDTISLLCLLVMTRNAWQPNAVAPVGAAGLAAPGAIALALALVTTGLASRPPRSPRATRTPGKRRLRA